MSNNEIAFTTIQKGSYCGVRVAKEVLITNRKSWNSFWDEFCTLIPQPEAPAIDFRKQMVLAVFMGQRPSGGYSITVNAVETLDDKVVVKVKKTKSSGMVTMAMTQPYHIVSIPRKRGLPLLVELEEANSPPKIVRRDGTYLLMLKVNYDGIKEGDRGAMAAASAEAIASFRKTFADFLADNKLNDQATIVSELNFLGGLVISTSKEVAERIRKLEGVDSIVEDGPFTS